MFIWIFKLALFILSIVVAIVIYRQLGRAVKYSAAKVRHHSWGMNCTDTDLTESIFVGVLATHGDIDNVRIRASVASTLEDMLSHASCPYRLRFGIIISPSSKEMDKHGIFGGGVSGRYPIVEKFIGRLHVHSIPHQSQAYRRAAIELARKSDAKYFLLVQNGIVLKTGWDARICKLFEETSQSDAYKNKKLLLSRGLMVVRGTSPKTGIPIYGFIDTYKKDTGSGPTDGETFCPDQAIGGNTYFLFGLREHMVQPGALDINDVNGACGSIDIFFMSICLFLRGFCVLGCVMSGGEIVEAYPGASMYQENMHPKDENILFLVFCAIFSSCRKRLNLGGDGIKAKKCKLKRKKNMGSKIDSATSGEREMSDEMIKVFQVFGKGIRTAANNMCPNRSLSDTERLLTVRISGPNERPICHPLGLLGLSSPPSEDFHKHFLGFDEWSNFLEKFKASASPWTHA